MSTPAAELTPLEPFGAEVRFPTGTRFDSLDVEQLRGWVREYGVVVLRGLAGETTVTWPVALQRVAPLQPWPFGAVHELRVDPAADNYLYTTHEVPLHWDGAFKGEIPGMLAFLCAEAPPPEAGGATVFVDSTAVWHAQAPETQARWQRASFRYTTERKAHYGGTFTADLVQAHPLTGAPVLRFAEPVNDLNPVAVEALTPEAVASQDGLVAALKRSDVTLRHVWQPGDVVLADNHRLLHGRDAFTEHAPRHLLRVNLLDSDQRPFQALRDSLRIRRLEFALAELPIVLVAALVAVGPSALVTRDFWLATGVLWLLYQVGDMANCLADRDLDVAGKTGISEAVRRLGSRNIAGQMGVSVLLALALAASLGAGALALTVLGVLVGVGYSLRPVHAKGRGLLQLPWSAGILFVGPMVLVGQVLGALSWRLVLTSLAFGLLQQAALLLNIVEDRREDIHHGVRTSGVVLGWQGSVRWARNGVVLGGLSLAAVLGLPLMASPLLWLASVTPLLLAAGLTTIALQRCLQTMQARPHDERHIARRAVPDLPGWLSAHGWMAVVAAWGAAVLV